MDDIEQEEETYRKERLDAMLNHPSGCPCKYCEEIFWETQFCSEPPEGEH